MQTFHMSADSPHNSENTSDTLGYSPQRILTFWFDKIGPDLWFAKSDELDQRIRQQFGALLNQAASGELWQWRKTAEGRLAEIIVLDQFSRNIYRDDGRAFAQDAMALALAQEAVTLHIDQQLNPQQRHFLYMPFMHSESRSIHQYAYLMFQRLGNEKAFDFEKRHKAIIDRFGRYPHRNAILGRPSTDEELEFLQQPDSHF